MEKEWRTSSQIRDEDVRQVQAFLKDDLTEPEMVLLQTTNSFLALKYSHF